MPARPAPSRAIACTALLAAAWATAGGVLGHAWVEVDNATSTITGDPTGLDDGTFDGRRYRTFDLFIEVDAPVIVVDSAITQSQGDNGGLRLTGGTLFQQTLFGSENNLPPNPAALPIEPLLEFDTYAGLGDLPAGSILQAAPVAFTSSLLTGTWSPSIGVDPPGSDGPELAFIARFTASPDPARGDLFLGGELFIFTEDNVPGRVITIGNAFAPPPCPGDANGDRQVNAADLSVLIGAFGSPADPAGSGADFNGDGIVNAADLSVLIGGFGTDCDG